MRDAVGCPLSVVDLAVEGLPFLRVAVVGHQLGKRMRRLHNALRMLVEHLEKIAFARQQFAKQHVDSPIDGVKKLTYL